MAGTPIYLASQSPRRRELLKQIGIPFEALMLRSDPRRGIDVDETPLPDESPGSYALRVAREKAATGMRQMEQRRLPQRLILSADTTVVLDDRIIGKPENTDDAHRILTSLSGREHRVITVVAAALRGEVDTRMSMSTVWFRALADPEIRRYVATGEPMDKAGAYGIQGRAASFVTKIDGSYSGIVGLPLAETCELLQRFGVSIW
jgi:septum formation protein